MTDQINEALAAYRRWVDDEDVPDSELVARVITAHERAKRDWITCPTCGGTGLLDAKSYEIPGVCPDCVDGMIPSPELEEREANIFANIAEKQGWDCSPEMSLKMTRAILLAFRRKGATR